MSMVIKFCSQLLRVLFLVLSSVNSNRIHYSGCVNEAFGKSCVIRYQITKTMYNFS